MKSPIVAFLLALFPGLGHLYLGHKIKGVIYPVLFIGAIGLALITGVFIYSDIVFLFFFAVAACIWFVNILDIIFTIVFRPNTNHDHAVINNQERLKQNERFSTILLSFIPGVGHFYLGLTHRGLTIVAAFFGIITMVFFVSVVTSGVFLIFLLALPIIWIYSMFDAIQLLNKKQAGEPLEDKTIMEDFEKVREEGKKSKMLAIVLSIVPGAGHMYLGLQKRGLQLMAAFLLFIYILDVLGLAIFLFVIPIIWFFSFFDALQSANKADYETVDDIPIIKYFVNHQKWVGIGLLILGFFYLFDAVLLPSLASTINELFNIDIWYYYHQYFQVTLVCLLLIGGGIRLIIGSKKSKKEGSK